jgi:predicted CoA-substrate-specific enzyme activase
VFEVLPTGWNSKITAGIIKDDLLKRYGDIDDSSVVATGYGRISVDYADKVITEITCHGRGGYEMIGRDCTIIDIGGQDTKYINVKGGKPIDFLMNDKCAAGTGKFIEVMANRLGLTIEELFELAEIGDPISISSLCTVFAESEVISLLAKKLYDPCDIMMGIHSSVVRRVNMLVQKARLEPPIVMTGGVAKNVGVISAFERLLNTKLLIPSDPQLIGAVGAAVLALETYQKSKDEDTQKKPYNRRRYY